uniref:Uncharacterized protein n=1 Tax=Trichobilharzia regenti TaxID=157069 RepID=A0AA85J3G9_TRIRE|nr:unnamed protein product [Trichobilharzia regenti]
MLTEAHVYDFISAENKIITISFSSCSIANLRKCFGTRENLSIIMQGVISPFYRINEKV